MKKCAVTQGRILNGAGQMFAGTGRPDPSYVFFDEEDDDPISQNSFSENPVDGICYYREPLDASAYRTMEYPSLRALVARGGALDPETRGRLCDFPRRLEYEDVQFCLPYTGAGERALMQLFRYIRLEMEAAHWAVALPSEDERREAASLFSDSRGNRPRIITCALLPPRSSPRFVLALQYDGGLIRARINMHHNGAFRSELVTLPWRDADKLFREIQETYERMLSS